MKSLPKFDGKLDEWASMLQLAILNSKVADDDATCIGNAAWDNQYLYIAIRCAITKR